MMASEYYTGALTDDHYYGNDNSVKAMEMREEAYLPSSEKHFLGKKPEDIKDHWSDEADHWDTFAPNKNPMNWGVHLDCPPYAPDCNGDGGSKGTGTAFAADEVADEATGTTKSQLRAGQLRSNSGIVNVGIEGKPVQYSAFMDKILQPDAGASEGERQIEGTTREQHNNDALLVPLGGVFLMVGFLFLMVMVLFKKRQSQQAKQPTTLLPSDTAATPEEENTTMASL
jgi:hypothetical protein